MSAIASRITGVSIFYWTVCSGVDQRKHQSFGLLAFVRGNSSVTGDFPAQQASNVENLSISWRHHNLVSCDRNDSRYVNFSYIADTCMQEDRAMVEEK